jgi:hypothetical protein
MFGKITYENTFSKEECENIISWFEQSKTFFQEEKNGSKFETSLIYPNQQTGWLFDKLFRALISVNMQYFKFSLTKLSDTLQLIKHDKNQLINWRKDLGSEKLSTKKISIMVFLSDTNNYQGGEVEAFLGFTKLNQEKGTILFFPSYIPYKIDGMTEGEKYILMGWGLGPHFS